MTLPGVGEVPTMGAARPKPNWEEEREEKKGEESTRYHTCVRYSKAASQTAVLATAQSSIRRRCAARPARGPKTLGSRSARNARCHGGPQRLPYDTKQTSLLVCVYAAGSLHQQRLPEGSRLSVIHTQVAGSIHSFARTGTQTHTHTHRSACVYGLPE